MNSVDEVLRAVRDGRPITGVAVSARVDMSAHALNNEGSRNNAMMPRQVDVVAGTEVVQVNAISGDSTKHTFVDHLRAAIGDQGSDETLTPICEPCRIGDPNRLNADPVFIEFAKSREQTNGTVVGELIRRCAIDDIAGLLVTIGNRNAPRRSTVQFGWQLGVPEHVRTGRYTHVKLVPADPKGSEVNDGSNLGQNIFTRPASSGVYAFIGNCDLSRIGRNDLTLDLEISDPSRRARTGAVLSAMFHTVALPGGAQRNTQLPHLHGAQGALAVSVSRVPPVIYSPLAEDFVEQMGRIANAFGRAGADHFVVPFADLAELGQALGSLSTVMRAE